MQETTGPPGGGSLASPVCLSPHRMQSTTCSAASIQASGSPTPSPVRPRRERRQVPGTLYWKLSSQMRRMSARDPPQLLPACLQASVPPFSENENRCHCPSSWLPSLPPTLQPGRPAPCPPPRTHPSLALSQGPALPELPHQRYAKGPGVQEGAEGVRPIHRRGEGPPPRGCSSHWALFPLSAVESPVW